LISRRRKKPVRENKGRGSRASSFVSFSLRPLTLASSCRLIRTLFPFFFSIVPLLFLSLSTLRCRDPATLRGFSVDKREQEERERLKRRGREIESSPKNLRRRRRRRKKIGVYA